MDLINFDGANVQVKHNCGWDCCSPFNIYSLLFNTIAQNFGWVHGRPAKTFFFRAIAGSGHGIQFEHGKPECNL